jgi:4-amino-4-deoxy-L-arabinose transferase-like glycosyltransferase
VAVAVGCAVVVALGLLLPGLGSAPLDDPGEGQQAEIARELWAGGDPLDLRLNGVRYFDKPPLLYWLGAAAFSRWGPTEWAARLGPALSAALAVAGTALLGARLLGPAWGLAAGGALATSTFFLVYGRYVRPETLFVAAIQWGFTGLLLAGRGPERGWALLGCAALGMAGLAKDPLGVLGPVAAVGLARGLAGRFRPVSSWLPPLGVAMMLGLGFGWYALVGARDPGFLWYTVVDNHLLNVARSRHFPDEDVPLTAFEFVAVAGLGALPWTIPAVLMGVGLLGRRAWRDPREIPWTALAAWAAGVLAVFTASPFKLPHYGLPAYPALALLAVRWWRDRAAGDPRRAIGFHALLFGALALALAAAVWSGGRGILDLMLSISDVSTRNALTVGETVPGVPWAALDPLFRRMAAVFGAAALALMVLAWRRAPRAALGVVLAAMLATMTAASAAVDASMSARSVATLAGEVRTGLAADELLVHEGPIENSGALEFYSGRRPILLEARRSVLGFGGTYPDADGAFWDATRFRREWLAGQAIALLTPREPPGSVISSLPPETVEVVARHNGRTLYRRQPASANRDERPGGGSGSARDLVREVPRPRTSSETGGKHGGKGASGRDHGAGDVGADQPLRPCGAGRPARVRVGLRGVGRPGPHGGR